MSPQQRGQNWTLIALVISTGITIFYVGRTSGRIENEVAKAVQRLDTKDAKDAMQDGHLGMLDIRTSVVESEVQEIKRRQPERTTPVFNEWPSVRRTK